MLAQPVFQGSGLEHVQAVIIAVLACIPLSPSRPSGAMLATQVGIHPQKREKLLQPSGDLSSALGRPGGAFADVVVVFRWW